MSILAIVMLVLGGLAAGYVVASVILLKKPHLLHGEGGHSESRRGRGSRRRNFPRCVHICHRGGAAEAYENTVSAFSNAVRLGAHMLELDVQRSRDGVAVVSHDADLRRLCRDPRRVCDVDFAHLPPLAATVPVDFPGDSFHDPSLGEDGRRFTSLEEVFRLFPQVAINIDVKQHDEALVRTVDELIRRFGREDRTVWGSFRDKTTDLLHHTNPDVGLFFSMRRVVTLLVLFYTGLLPFVSLRETHLEIPMLSTMIRPGQSRKRKALLRLGDAILLRPELFRHLRERGVPTYVWVLNHEDDFERAFRCGATGVMTDYPSKLKQFLESHPEWA